MGALGGGAHKSPSLSLGAGLGIPSFGTDPNIREWGVGSLLTLGTSPASAWAGCICDLPGGWPGMGSRDNQSRPQCPGEWPSSRSQAQAGWGRSALLPMGAEHPSVENLLSAQTQCPA